MKKGESLRVFIENVQVGRGEITAVREGEIEVTVPGFVSVIATRTSLTDEPTSLEQNSNREVQVTGLEVVDAEGNSVGAAPVVNTTTTEPPAAPVAPAANAPVEVPTENTEAVTGEAVASPPTDSSVSGESTESTNTDQ